MLLLSFLLLRRTRKFHPKVQLEGLLSMMRLADYGPYQNVNVSCKWLNVFPSFNGKFTNIDASLIEL